MATNDAKRDAVQKRLEEAKKRIDDALRDLPNATDKELDNLDRDTGGAGSVAPAFVDFNKGCN